jgi:hypothetical protein
MSRRELTVRPAAGMTSSTFFRNEALIRTPTDRCALVEGSSQPGVPSAMAEGTNLCMPSCSAPP